MPERHRFIALDGLRGIAALVVVVWHAGATRLIPGGYLAVDLFFVLSGFVLSFAFGERGNWRSFMATRLKRLYPLYAAGLTLGAGVALAIFRIDGRYWESIGAGIFMIPTSATWGPVYRPYPFDSPAWSLFFELLVNAAWFAIIPWLSRIALGAIICISGIALAVIIAINGSAAVGDAGGGFLWQGLVRATFSFFVGVACFRLWKRRAPRFKPAIWVLALAFLVLVAAPLPRTWIDGAAIFAVFPAMIYFGAGTALTGRVARVCEGAGRASYAVYTLHAPLLVMVTLALARYAPELPHADYLIAAAAVPLMLLVGSVADRFYDAPLRRLTRHPGGAVVDDRALGRAAATDG